ncbi:MAG: 50S ribosomal protein L21 [Verrucomicrobia bacterium]|nr:MAG: 50S ribosomal protein L21 [Verrucomicrobiota bacterium]
MAYAIFKTGGKQYRVCPGDIIDVELLDVEVGSQTLFNEVLLVSSEEKISLGTPFLNGASIAAEVVEQRKDEKITAFKFKRRKGYHRTVGHRRRLTRLKITEINH